MCVSILPPSLLFEHFPAITLFYKYIRLFNMDFLHILKHLKPLVLVSQASPVASPLPLSPALSRNPIDPNGLISGVCAITHMRTGRNLSHFLKETN